MTAARLALAGCTFFLLLAPALAERRRDPLTAPEIDQLRDTAMEPVHPAQALRYLCPRPA